MEKKKPKYVGEQPKPVRAPRGPRVEFVEPRLPPGPCVGARAASRYIFKVDEKEIAVDVFNTAKRTRDGYLPEDKVRDAAEAFLKSEADSKEAGNLPEILELNEPAMDRVVNRLGWTPRFPKL